MQLRIPAELDEFFVYIWKIIDKESIPWKDLVHIIAFDFSIANPKKIKARIITALKQGILIQKEGQHVTLAPALKQKVEEFHAQGAEKVDRINELLSFNHLDLKKKHSAKTKREKEEEFDLSEALEFLSTKSTVTRGLKIADKEITFETKDLDKVIQGTAQGSGSTYTFLFDLQLRSISHNCQNFTFKKAKSKQICKHLVKVFELLHKAEPVKTEKLIQELQRNRMSWSFRG